MSFNPLINAEKITAIFTDLDNTLWNGIVAEKQDLILKTEYYEMLKSLWQKGIQIFAVSKNDFNDVEFAFKTLGINKEIFTLVVANWDAKYLNVDRLIHQTKLRPETCIFIDDNLLERNEVSAKIPTIGCIDSNDWRILENIKYLNKKQDQSLGEINERMNRYKTAIAESKLKIDYKKADLEFYRKLKREISIGLIDADNLDRYTRMFFETHRINFNPNRFKDYDNTLEILHDALNTGNLLYAISAKEDESQLGLIGGFVVKINGDVAEIRDATFSCGVIGRDFEQKSILALIKILKKLGLKKIVFFVTLTPTNKRVREIFENLGFDNYGVSNEQKEYSINLKSFVSKNNYDWIRISNKKPYLNYSGHIHVINFYEKFVKSVIQKQFNIVNLGSARGEVLGLLQEDKWKEFYDFIEKNNLNYKKIDLEYRPKEDNIVGDAEDLNKILETNSQDLVIAIELLEHTEHFWKVINEMIRICKVNGYIFVTCPTYNYPKHEYPIDLWRIGPNTLKSFFPEPYFEIVAFENEGNPKQPRRIMLLVKKKQEFLKKYDIPKDGKTNWNNGLTIFD